MSVEHAYTWVSEGIKISDGECEHVRDTDKQSSTSTLHGRYEQHGCAPDEVKPTRRLGFEDFGDGPRGRSGREAEGVGNVGIAIMDRRWEQTLH